MLDTQRFGIALSTLIDNAMKFTKEGWIKVKLSKVEGGKK